ncbi:MAG TPA: TM0106 family RecB-like putative nuclease [Gaiellaceae bacterium]|nr:TM0106 family RecB-like putative nuclease [Gaiellaceae bacterium]
MRLGSDGTLRFSPTDLGNHLACVHLTQLELCVVRGELVRPQLEDPYGDVIRRKGNAHERAYLERLETEGKRIARMPVYEDEGFDSAEARRLTEEAIRAGEADVVYQAYLTDGTWRGFADFLERRPDGTYEPVDTKLARSAKPGHLIQLCFYATELERIQGKLPEHLHVELGTGERETFRTADYIAFFRRSRERFLAALGLGADGRGLAEARPQESDGSAEARPQESDGSGLAEARPGESDARPGESDARPVESDARPEGSAGRGLASARPQSDETYPWPCDHCRICDFRGICGQQLRDDDHLVLVAGLGRRYAEALAASGIPTLTALGDTAPLTEVDGVRPEAFEKLRHQASLQLHFARTGEHRVDHLPDEEGKGFRMLPAPSPGDVWLDLEGHPFYEPARGLEYLFGWCYRDEEDGTSETSGAPLKRRTGRLRYEAVWGTDREGERAAFERFVDWVVERRRRFPDLHVYHYASYERTALRRLMGEHSTREHEIDDWLRQEVLVDLYRVVYQALRASVPSYSIKEIEKLYGFVRTAEVAGGDESVVLFERWLEAEDGSLLEGIRAYNEEDCRSLQELHEWLLRHRPPDLPWREPPEGREPSEEVEERDAARAALAASLLAGAEEGDPRFVLAHLLSYHRREAKSQWWEWFHHLSLDEEELLEDTDTIGGIELTGEPVADKQSLVYTLSFPPQEHKVDGECVDPASGKSYHVRVDDERGLITFRRGRRRADEPLPAAVIPPPPIPDTEQRKAVERFARAYVTGGAIPALVDVLERGTPRARLDLPVPEAALSLDGSYLFVQGPPGSGKTWQGAKAAVVLMRAGRRVGITSLSHKAIGTLLSGIEREARRQGFSFRGRKKSSGDDDTRFEGDFVDSSDEWRDLLDPELELVAGTAWLFAREEFHGRGLAEVRPQAGPFCDTLIVDEAGQVALADVIAIGSAARNLVFLGDPNQLPQVSQGAHPETARVSVLQHLLGSETTVPPDRGIFLAETWRLRPEIVAFTSDAYYAGRLDYAEVTTRRSVAAGDGLVFRPVEHAGNGQMSWEEAREVAAAIEALLGTPHTEDTGATRPLGVEDVLVVTPYNAQVRALRQAVPAGVRVGTVDKFQGQEAPVVLVSLASSSGEEAPRGLAFVFNRNRINVATSRAQCRVELVCSPRLLEADCRTVEQMCLANALCRFVELATIPGQHR